MEKRSHEHPVLGNLHWDERVSAWEAKVHLTPGCHIRFAILVEADGWRNLLELQQSPTRLFGQTKADMTLTASARRTFQMLENESLWDVAEHLDRTLTR